ncbi:MAG: hypothetical protein AAAFM81_07315 [Pseudomonadota bacterium]
MSKPQFGYWRRIACGLAMAFWLSPAHAAPGDILFSDGFERNQLNPWTTTDANRAGITTGAQVSNGGTRGGFTRYGAVSVTSPNINAAVPAATITLWVRRGSDAFSELPDNGEDLLLEFRRADNSWGALTVYPGGGPAGQIFNTTLTLPPDALHGSLAVRFRQTGGSGQPFDFYHFDDVLIVEAVPGSNDLVVGSCDEFSSGLANNWTVTSGGGSAGTSGATSQSPTESMFLNGDPVTVTSNPIDTSVANFDLLSVWIRRGADAFSENPDGNENLLVEYLNDSGGWVSLENLAGSGTPGQIFLRNYAIPTDGRHTGFRVRFVLVDGSGPQFDFWHVDDVCLTERDVPDLNFAKVVSVISDPINGTVDPLAIPGAFSRYQLTVQNDGAGATDNSTLVITDALDDGTSLLVDDGGSSPFVFLDGAVSSGLSFDAITGVTFSNQPGGTAPYNYVPTPDGSGIDPAVTGIQFTFAGALNGDTGGGVPSFTISFIVRIE